jgi:alanyl-tRNA synthetase
VLRFDFANMDAVSDEQLATIENQTNQRIAEALPINAEILPLESARQQGAMMLFGEKYPDPVRMVSIGDFSKELCGGIHLENSSDVEAFEIFSEENMGAGTRRIQALTGQRARDNQERMRSDAETICGLLSIATMQIPGAVAGLSQQVKDLKKQLSSGRKSAGKDSKHVLSKTDVNQSPSYFEIRELMRQAAQGLNVAVLNSPSESRRCWRKFKR